MDWFDVCAFPTAYITYACQDTALTLNCFTGGRVAFNAAVWGRAQNNDLVCPHNTIASRIAFHCQRDVALELSNTCGSSTDCKFDVTSALLGDPCPGVYKYLKIDYSCVQGTCFSLTMTNK
jgi:hypothetical protein